MRTSELLLGLLSVLSSCALAQNYPKVEASAGYMYLRFNPSIGPSANCSGGYGAVGSNLSKTTAIGIATDVPGCSTKSRYAALFVRIFGSERESG